MISFKLNTASMRDALAKLDEQIPGLEKKIVRKLAFQGLRDIVVSITTGAYGNPTRVDTGRYRAAWVQGSRVLGLGLAGSPKGGQAGDGEGVVSRVDGRTTAVITNSVEYAEYVEFGTLTMQAGNHVAVALQRMEQDADELIQAMRRR